MNRGALIGAGARAPTVVSILTEPEDEATEVVGILELPEFAAEARSRIGDGIPVVERGAVEAGDRASRSAFGRIEAVFRSNADVSSVVPTEFQTGTPTVDALTSRHARR